MSTFNEVHVNLKTMIFPPHTLERKEESSLLSGLINICHRKTKMLRIVLLAIYFKMIMFIVREMLLLVVGLINTWGKVDSFEKDKNMKQYSQYIIR